MEDSPFLEWFWPSLMVGILYFVVFLFGSVVGSFLNVLIYRLPLVKPGESVLEAISGKSFCPNCRTYLAPYHNVPILGFLALRGRCGFCKTPISWRYIMVELVTASLWVALYHKVVAQGGTFNVGVLSISPLSLVDFLFQAVFVSLLVALVFIDLDYFIAPDELNATGFLVGLGRDLVCLGLVYALLNNRFAVNSPGTATAQYAYFGWLPIALAGAALYGAILFAVSFFGFIYYARGQKESFASVARRFFTFEDLPEEMLTAEEKQQMAAMQKEAEAEARQGPPPRLQFSPGFVALLSALFLAPVIGLFAVLVFLLPFTGFLILSGNGQPFGAVVRRFFSANDLAPPPEHKTVEVIESRPAEAGSVTLSAQEEANQFAIESETGKHGGMGLGDVKLAFAIGAMLGPGMAVLSLLIATFLGAVVGIIFTRMHGRSLRYGVPFVPFMAAGAIVVMLYGSAIVDGYLTYSGLKKAETPSERPTLRRPVPTPDPIVPYIAP